MVVAASWAPTLLDEALASLRGYKALRDHGSAILSANRVLPSAELAVLLRAFSTYGLSAIGAVLGIVLFRKMRQSKQPTGISASVKTTCAPTQ
ncbi:MAG: hypothetical protein H6729_08145 [Deltaproteobacteria bacterium]|nr:hypothetical protein [Deltaproteobacteria bacterium]